MMLSLFLFRYNLASRFYSFANPPPLFSFCGHNVCCLFHLIDFLLRTFFFSIQVYFSKESFSPFLVSRCHHCRFECQNFFLWSKLSDFFIWKIQTFFTLLKSRTKMECQNGINSNFPKFVWNFIFILMLISLIVWCVYYLRIINTCIPLSYSWLYQIGHKYSYWSSWIET